jgi:hypothetical protein
MSRNEGVPSCCTFCGAGWFVVNEITGVAVFKCHTHWDSQRGGRFGLWQQSNQCRDEELKQAAKAGGE